MNTYVNTYPAEAIAGERFEFGENWRLFLRILTPERIAEAEESLRSALNTHDLVGKTFLDIGSGSGLFSLAARRLGAHVHSFDYDPQSVACTKDLRDRYLPGDCHWTVETGSVLDTGYLESLPKFDIVYSWGVLHHTGAVWQAIENASKVITSGGAFLIAIYNDQEGISRKWAAVKRLYLHSPGHVRLLLAGCCFVWVHWSKILKGAMRGRPLEALRSPARGMSPWRDVVDWVGGYPFEVCKAGEVFQFLYTRGFTLEHLVTTHGSGCNEFVLRKNPEPCVSEL
jgi:2-polyprenyl-6-hydroxyphenyl methylase/3-demethylubiquinone-9 3-methyltransferase